MREQAANTDSIGASIDSPTIPWVQRSAQSKHGVAQRMRDAGSGVAGRFAIGGTCCWRQGDRRRGGREWRHGLRGMSVNPMPATAHALWRIPLLLLGAENGKEWIIAETNGISRIRPSLNMTRCKNIPCRPGAMSTSS
jgi:hypothetical protein